VQTIPLDRIRLRSEEVVHAWLVRTKMRLLDAFRQGSVVVQ
jgi:hypothetical protein